MAKNRALRILALSVLVMGAAEARPAVEAFYGNWENAGRDQSDVSHVLISPAGGNQVTVRVYGDCHPIECSWGQVDGQTYSADPHSRDIESITATFNAGFARKQIIFRKGTGGRLRFVVLTDFSDGSGRHDFETSGTLKPSAWAGPLNQNWERAPASNTGWGGGARSGAAVRPQETCTAVDGKAAKLVRAGGSWKVMAGDKVLVEAGGDEHAAQRALLTIHHYGFNRMCRAGATPDVYWKTGDGFPRIRMGGADCILFNSTTAHATPVGHDWKIVDGVQVLGEFGTDKAKADTVLSLIRFHHLDAECFVRRPNPVMSYWLAF